MKTKIIIFIIISAITFATPGYCRDKSIYLSTGKEDVIIKMDSINLVKRVDSYVEIYTNTHIIKIKPNTNIIANGLNSSKIVFFFIVDIIDETKKPLQSKEKQMENLMIANNEKEHELNRIMAAQSFMSSSPDNYIDCHEIHILNIFDNQSASKSAK